MPKSRNRQETEEEEAARVRREETLKLHRLLFLYAERRLAPQRMAEMRRRRGDSRASPRDYDCRCPVPKEDGLPDCWPGSAECRFRDRMRPRPKFHCNKYAHDLARELYRDLWLRWNGMPIPERLAIFEKALELSEAEKRRYARLEREPPPEPAPFRDGGTRSDAD